jgi:hypothetical protein
MKKMIIGVAMALSSFSVLAEESTVKKVYTVQHFNPATGLVTPYGYAPYRGAHYGNTGFNNFGNGNGYGYGDGAVNGGFNFGMSGRAQGRGYGQGNGNWSHSHVSNGVHRH